MSVTAADRDHFECLVHRLISMGSVPLALYGAGQTVFALRSKLALPEGVLAGIIDDDPAKAGTRWGDTRIIDFDTAVEMGVKGAILTAVGSMQDALWARRERFRKAGIYLLVCPQRFKGETWDDCLVDHYEYTVARARGLNPPYGHAYPTRDARLPEWILDPLLKHVKPGDTVVEIGAGSGMSAEKMIGRAGTYHIVDISERLFYEVIEHRFAEHMGKLHLHLDTSARLEGVPDACADLLFSYDVFVHLKIDVVHQFLDSVKRVLRPGGTALVHFAGWNGPAIEEWRRSHRPDMDGRHSIMHYNHIDWLRHSAEAAGLAVEQVACQGARFFARFVHR
jgi:SAM-dependent methyltransferase